MQELKDLNVLIVDSSGYSKNLLRQILLVLGVNKISAHGRTANALEAMRHELFHIAFCDENCGPLPPPAFIRALRSDLETRNVIIPMVLVTNGGADFSLVAQWRDSGGSDVIVKPVSPMVIQNRLVSLVLNPKPFVTTRTFIGPDRRRGERREEGERSPYGVDRRRSSEEGVVFAAPRTIDPDMEPRA